MPSIDRVLNITLVAAAVVMTVAVARRELRPSVPPSSSRQTLPPRMQKAWTDILPHAVALGDSKGPVQIIEFADFECPFCRKFDSTVRVVTAAYPAKISRYFVHYPLSTIHRFAVPAARAADCAGKLGRFVAMHDLLFAKQDSFGLKPWVSYARESGITDTSSFEDCITMTDRIPLVADGIQTGKQLNIDATPTVIINGWRFVHPPSDSVLRETIDALLAGKRPPAADRKPSSTN